MDKEKVLCPTGFYVTKEECDMCEQCRPSKWGGGKLAKRRENHKRENKHEHID